MPTTNSKNPVDYIIHGLQTAATELEELQVQMALGKAEARDVFENTKKSLNGHLQQLKLKIRLAKTNEDVLPIVNALEHLQVQLSLGFAETKEIFEEQRRNIERSVSDLETKLRSGEHGELIAKMEFEIEKFKSNLQLLSLNYELKKIKLEYNLKQKKEDFEQKLRTLRTKLELKEEQVKHTWQHFKDEIKEGFSDLRSAFLPHD